MPPDDRPRERLLKAGASALRDAELIAILLRTGTKGSSAIEVAEDMLRRYGSLEALARAPISELAKILGVGPAKAVQLNAAFSLGARLSKSVAASKPISDPQTISELLSDEMRLLDYESVRVLSVNTKHCLLAIDEISRGSLNQSICTPRDVFRPALARQAYGIVVVHNHPSGDPTPSKADLIVTRELFHAGELLNIILLDHVILGAPRPGDELNYYSFREHDFFF